METNRQKKIAGVLQKDLVDILQGYAKEHLKGVIISVTQVHVTADLSVAKIYVSIFPVEHRKEIFADIEHKNHFIRHELAHRTRNQLRRMPDLFFHLDDSLDYIEAIDKSLKGKDENPIANPELLSKRLKK